MALENDNSLEKTVCVNVMEDNQKDSGIDKNLEMKLLRILIILPLR